MLDSAAPTIIFLHIPKTAGTTLHRILDREYRRDGVFTIMQDAHKDIATFKALGPDEKAKIRLLRGHMNFGLHSELEQESRYFTLLRDPVERVISDFYFIQRMPDHYLYEPLQKMGWDLDRLLQSKLPLMMDNGQTRLLSGVWGDVPFGQLDGQILDLARRNLKKHFAVVGLQEQFDTTLLLLQQTFGWRRIDYSRTNVTKSRPKQTEIPQSTITAIRDCNQLDSQLYEFANEHLAKTLAEQSFLFKARCRTFPLENWLRRQYWDLRKISLRQKFKEIYNPAEYFES